jgi:Ca-activated chloride channel family protein
VQSIVALSTRYGIITPYTSFLIEEDDIAAQSAPQLMEQAELALAAPDAVSGAAAVERADAESDLAAAEAPLPMATMTVADGAAPGAVVAAAPVQIAGDRTFFLRGGVWVDSAYDATAGEPAVIPFASDAYFELLSARPELGAALALGEEVLVVVDGVAYRITTEGDTATEVTLPATTPESEQPIAQGEATPAPFPTPISDEATPSGGVEAFGVGVPGCASAMLLPLLAVVGLGWSRRRRP